MAFYAKKTSILGSGAVPTDGVMYYTGNKTWSNEESDKVTFDSEAVLTAELQITRVGVGTFMPTGVQIVSE